MMSRTRDTLWRHGIEIDNGRNGDAWGSSMCAWFDIAHAIEHYGTDYVPHAWNYRDSMGCRGLDKHESGENDSARSLAAGILRGRESDIVRAGNVLKRYTRILKRAGRDY